MINTKLLELRQNLGYTQQEIADKLLLTQSMVSKIETGLVKIDFELALRFADFYNVSLDYLAGRSDKRFFQLSESEINDLPLNEKNALIYNLVKLINASNHKK